MFTYKFIVKGKKNSLKIRLFRNRKMTEISIPGISVDEENLKNALSKNPLGANIRLARCLKQWDSQISSLRLNLIQNQGESALTILEIREMITTELFNTMREEPDQDTELLWEKYYERYVETKKNRSYRESCQYTLNKMRELCDGFSKLKFEDITLKWLNDFDEALSESGASQNTRNIHFKNIRTCLNRAIDEELTNNYPFRRFKIRAEETRKRNLPVEELRRLFEYPVEEYQKYYLDYFKLIFFLIGINTIDLFNLTSIENGRVEYRRAKTHRLYSIKVEPEAMEIIDRHRAKNGNGLLDITDRWKSHRDFQKFCNIALKKIGQFKRVGRGGKKVIEPEWPELSTYWARHSWATIAADLDIPDAVIAEALGHSSPYTTTTIYINRNRKKVDEANRRVLDWVLYGKC